MFEKIKAWIKRKRETAREQQAADRLIKHIEQALSVEYNTVPEVSETDTDGTESEV